MRLFSWQAGTRVRSPLSLIPDTLSAFRIGSHRLPERILGQRISTQGYVLLRHSELWNMLPNIVDAQM